MSERGSALVIGASAGVGRALASGLARRGVRVIAASRHQRDLDALAADLTARWQVEAIPLTVDLAGDESQLSCFVDRVLQSAPSLNAVYIPAGILIQEDEHILCGPELEGVIRGNYVGVLHLLSLFADHFGRAGRGTLVAFSSIAAAAPRSRNMAYASAKAGLESYCRSLQHRFAGTRIHIAVYALGYVDTAMSFGRRMLLPPVAAEAVAEHVLSNTGPFVGVQFFPRYWALIVRGLKLLPWSVYRRLSF